MLWGHGSFVELVMLWADHKQLSSPMNLAQLEAFVSVATLKGFGAAASRLNVTQPAISLRVKALEDSLGVKLFDRSGHGFRLTPRGLELMPHAERIIEASQAMRASASDSAIHHQKVRVGTVSALASAWMPHLVNEVITQLKYVSFDLIVEPTLRLREALLAGEIDVAIVMGDIQAKGVRSIPLGTYQMQWIASRSMALPRGRLTLQDVARYPIVTHGRESATYSDLADTFRKKGIWPVRLIASNSADAIIQLVELGSCMGLISCACLEERPSASIRVLPCEIPLPTHTYSAVFHTDSVGELGMRVAEMAQRICRDPNRRDRAAVMPAAVGSPLTA